MKLYYHTHEDLIGTPTEMTSIRLAYMLANESVVNSMIWYLMNLTKRNIRISSHDKIIHTRQSLEHLPEHLNAFDRSADALKMLRKIKHKTSKEILLIKRFEECIDNYFQYYLKSLENNVSILGYDRFAQITGKEGLSFYDIVQSDPECGDDGHNPASQVLTRYAEIPAEMDQEVTFFLPENVFTLAFKEQPYYTPDDAAAQDPANCWFERVGALPHINLLSGPELTEVRRQLRMPCQAFREHGSQWIRNSYAPDYTGSGLDYYRTHLREPARQTIELMNENQVIKTCNTTMPNPLYMELWIGEMPATRIWDFYEAANITQPATAAALEPFRALPDYRKRWPVMALRLADEAERIVPAIPKEEALPSRRKTLLID